MERDDFFNHGVSTSPKHSPLRTTQFSFNLSSNMNSEEEDIEEFWNSGVQEDKPKQKRSKRTFQTPQLPQPPPLLPLITFNNVDYPSNPYLEVPKPVTGNAKVTFVDFRDGVNVHEYSLQDERGGYTRYLTSISAMLDTWLQWNKQDHVDDDVPDIDPRLKRAIDAHKASKASQSGFRFNSSVPIISQIFTDYFNLFCEGEAPIPEGRQTLSFNERREFFLSLQDGKSPKNVDQFLPSKVFCDFEIWFKAGCPTFTPFQEQSHALRLARLVYNPDCPGFEHIENYRLRHVFKAFLDDAFTPMTVSNLRPLTNTLSICCVQLFHWPTWSD